MKPIGQTTKHFADPHKKNFKVTKFQFPFWQRFFSDQILLPRIKVNIQNQGSKIDKVQVSFYLGKLDSTDQLTSLIGFKGSRTGFLSQTIDNWKPNKVKTFNLKLKTDLIEPNLYFIFIHIDELIPHKTTITSQIEEINRTDFEESKKRRLIKNLEEERALNNSDEVIYYEGSPLEHKFISKIIKVSAQVTVLTNLSIIFAFIGGLISGIIWLVNILLKNYYT